MLTKQSAEKVASEYYEAGLQLALQEAGITKTAAKISPKRAKQIAAALGITGGGGYLGHKLLSAGKELASKAAPLEGAGGYSLLPNMSGGLEGLASKAAPTSKASVPNFQELIANLTGRGSELPVKAPFARIGEEGLGGMSRAPAADDLMSQILASSPKANMGDSAIAESIGIPGMFKNLMQGSTGAGPGIALGQPAYGDDAALTLTKILSGQGL